MKANAALTDINVRSLKAPDKGQKFYADAATPGFGVRVSQGGTKTFVLMYGEPRRRLTIGRFPTISLAEARKIAKDRLAEATLNKFRATPITFEEAKKAFLEHSRRKNRPRTVEEYTWLMQNFTFGRRQVSDISRSDVSAIINKLAERPSTQSHSLVMIKVFFTWCMYQGYIEHSPVAAIQARPRGPSRDHILTDKELAAVWCTATNEPYPFGPIVRLLILTGQRRTEIASLRWSWINFEIEEIVYPADFTKNRRSHTLPFTKSVREILDTLPRIDNSDYLFPAARKVAKGKETTVFNGWWKCKKAFDEKLEGVTPYNIHDLRRTFASKMAELGTPIQVTEKLLNHVSGTFSGVAGIYNRYTYLPEMRKALETYEAHILGLFARPLN